MFRPGRFPGIPSACMYWYFLVKCEIWLKIIQNHTFLCEENHVFSDPGDFPGSPLPPGISGGRRTPPDGGVITPTPGGGVKGPGFRGGDF